VCVRVCLVLRCQLWDLRTNTEVKQYTGHGFDTVACAFVPPALLPSGSPPLLATASKDCRYGMDCGTTALTHLHTCNAWTHGWLPPSPSLSRDVCALWLERDAPLSI
jgi:hypothetical protein